MAIPYSIYDLQANRGLVVVGTSHDTPAFAVDAICQWWRRDGHHRYPKAPELLILADCGGSNGARCRAWKLALQEKLVDPFQLGVTVCHYPTGASKWNPVEHRVFSEISKQWGGPAFGRLRNDRPAHRRHAHPNRTGGQLQLKHQALPDGGSDLEATNE